MAPKPAAIVIHKELSYKIVGLLFDIYNELGYGFKEKYYENAFKILLEKHQISYQEQALCKLVFEGKIIGRFYLDFIIEDKLILELKKGNYFSKKNISQVKEYLKVSKLQLAILANFTPNRVKISRVLNL